MSDSMPDAATSAWLNQERETMHRKMLSAVSHDLKTPLASVIGSLEVIERMKDRLSPEKQKELFGVALQEAYRLDAFVTNILDMAKLESGAVKAQVEQAEIGVVVRQALARMGRRMDHATVTVRAGKGALAVSTDSVILGRALALVLDNAVKYGGATPAITVSYGNDDKSIFIHVADEGSGIPEDRLDDIFCKYTRIAKLDSQVAGTGLGLAVCRELMRVLGGQIGVVPNAPRGSIFTLSLPVANLIAQN